MKRTEKMLSTLLMIVMFLTSAGLLYVSLFASSNAGSQSTLGSVVFEKETGIRYNNSTKEFEVFNEAGVSWIGSSRYISVDGIVAPSGFNPNLATYELADGNKTYNIMRDILYTSTYINEPANSSVYNIAFDDEKITLGASGVLDGRGFQLKNFVVKPVIIDEETIGSALVKANAGTIRNLNISNVDITSQAPATVATAAAIIVGKNLGTIDNCAVYGTDSDDTYETNKYTGLYGISAINANRITNCTNNANLINTATSIAYAAGIASVENEAILYNNINNGDITTTNAGHAAGIAIDSVGVVLTARGNVNNGNINGFNTASSIIDGGVELLDLTAKGNVNNGNLQGGTVSFAYYHGVVGGDSTYNPVPPIDYGIRWMDTLNSGKGGFEIYTTDGISWVSSGESFDENGKMLGEHVATGYAYYEIRAGIESLKYSDRTDLFNPAFNGADGVDVKAPSITSDPETLDDWGNFTEAGYFNGNDCWLEYFPIRRCNPTSSRYSGLFETVQGTVTRIRMRFDDTVSLHRNDAHVGGIVGFVLPKSTVSLSIVSGKIDCGIQGYVGGICGSADCQPGIWHTVGCSLISNSAIEVNFSGDIVGGIVGFSRASGEDYEQWHNGFEFDGILNGYTAAGGFGGRIGAHEKGTCKTNGFINAPKAGHIAGIWGDELYSSTGFGTQLLAKINNEDLPNQLRGSAT